MPAARLCSTSNTYASFFQMYSESVGHPCRKCPPSSTTRGLACHSHSVDFCKLDPQSSVTQVAFKLSEWSPWSPPLSRLDVKGHMPRAPPSSLKDRGDGTQQPISLKALKCELLGHVQLSVTPWTVAHKAPLSLGFLRQEYRSGLPFPSPGNLPNPGMELESPALTGTLFTPESPGKP